MVSLLFPLATRGYESPRLKGTATREKLLLSATQACVTHVAIESAIYSTSHKGRCGLSTQYAIQVFAHCDFGMVCLAIALTTRGENLR